MKLEINVTMKNPALAWIDRPGGEARAKNIYVPAYITADKVACGTYTVREDSGVGNGWDLTGPLEVSVWEIAQYVAQRELFGQYDIDEYSELGRQLAAIAEYIGQDVSW